MSSRSRSYSLNNARVVLPNQVLANGVINIDGDRISSVGIDDGTAGSSSDTLDLRGMSVFPGFIDVHIHGAMGIDVNNATAEELTHVSQFLASCGVTSWLPTLVPASDEEYRSAVAAIERASQDRVGAQILGLHYEGPFVNLAQCGALHREYFKTYQSEVDLDALPIPENASLKRMITMAPEIEGGANLVKELNRRGWIVSIGHTRADESTLDAAASAGARHMTHFMNAMPQLHHRQPGPVGWGLSRDDITCDIIADGIHLHPVTLRMLMKAKGSKSLSLISDAISAAGRGDGDYQIWGETISVKCGRTSNAAGSIAGSVITMLDAVRMMNSIGASDVEIARIASTNPAQLLGMDERGSIEEGKRADLVAVDQDGNVRLTIIAGEVVFQN